MRHIVFIFPLFLFCISFLPWILDPIGYTQILENVIFYSSAYGNSLLYILINSLTDINAFAKIIDFQVVQLIFVIMLIAGALFIKDCGSRSSCVIQSFFLYLIMLVLLTSAMADQYLVIPLVGLACYYRYIWSWLYCLVATYILVTSPNNFLGGNLQVYRFIGYEYAQICLAFIVAHIVFNPNAGKQTEKT